MTRRFERSGELLIWHTHANAPEAQGLEDHGHYRLKMWLALAALVMGSLFIAPHPLI